MKKRILGLLAAAALCAMSTAASAQTVTMTVRNNVTAPSPTHPSVTYRGNACVGGGTCPFSFPTPIAFGATSSTISATAGAAQTILLRVDYGFTISGTDHVCRYTLQTTKFFGSGTCGTPVVSHIATSGSGATHPSCPLLNSFLDSSTCNLTADFEIDY